MEALRPLIIAFYNNKNITEALTQHLLSVTYTDNVTGVSDDLQILLEDKDGKWVNEWYPETGANIQIEIGYNDGRSVKPNTFQIDEIEIEGDKDTGDSVTIKALSAWPTARIRTKKSYAHENKSLSEIVHTIAARNGYRVIGEIENITIGRVTQNREKDITFLNRLAAEYGYAFNIKGKTMVFTPLTELEAKQHVASFDKNDCIAYSFKDKSSEVYHGANVKSHNPNKNKVITGNTTINQLPNADGIEFSYIKSAGNTAEVRTKTENEQQANAKAAATLHKFNSLKQTGRITLPGNVLVVAGNNIELTGFGNCSGIWHILKSVHTLDKTTYTTECELKRVLPFTKSGSRKKPKYATVKNNNYKVVEATNRDGYNYSQITRN